MKTPIHLLPNEHVVLASDNDTLLLTNKRVRYNSSQTGASLFLSITLDSVASCGLVTRSYTLLLVLAAAAGIGAYTQRADSQTMAILFAVALILVLSYYSTRGAVISVASNGGQTILVPAKGMSRSSIIDFLDALELEKLRKKTPIPAA